VEEMAHRFEAEVIFLQVVESQRVIRAPTTEPFDMNLTEIRQRMKDAEAYLADLQGEFRKKNIKARRYVKHGPVVETIIDLAAREDAGLIAMASHGRSGLSRVFYGSVAAGVLQRVDRPLLLIRSRKNGQDD
jgi:nucleotide-binding universal stress UspA family protein